ncbi:MULTISPECIES: hypothetical protein [Streptomyces]|uniref:Lipoprotein n=1 Tax=Streptomyces viridochromogenes TaxID=1938 RepID=A0A0L8J2U0_STRVR|nr:MULTISPECIES: hypothetical protein [Streptomyces]KOG07993.1 hypothetical protein ADK34_39780 [Streptomyces viridochromogenes]
MTAWPRRLLLTAAVLPALAGCTVPVAGVTGVSVTADGDLLGVIRMCHGRIDGALLYPDDGDAPGTPETTAFWDHDTPVTGFTSWSLASPADGWTAGKAPGRLVPGQSYGFYGWTEDHSWSSGSVHFTTADLAKLVPGQVRYEYGDEVRTVSLDDFRAKACEDF